MIKNTLKDTLLDRLDLVRRCQLFMQLHDRQLITDEKLIAVISELPEDEDHAYMGAPLHLEKAQLWISCFHKQLMTSEELKQRLQTLLPYIEQRYPVMASQIYMQLHASGVFTDDEFALKLGLRQSWRTNPGEVEKPSLPGIFETESFEQAVKRVIQKNST